MRKAKKPNSLNTDKNTHLKDKFIKFFSNIDEFYDLVLLEDALGFSIKRKLNSTDEKYVSLLKIYITEKELKNNQNKKKLDIYATYGKEDKYGVCIRDIKGSKIGDPIDLTTDDYYYTISSDKFFKKKREFYPEEFLNNVYNDHVKPTRPIKGLWLRIKLIFWRIFIKSLLNYLSLFFHYCLYVITGDKYSFEPVLKEEILNGKTISSKWDSKITPTLKRNIEEKDKEGKKMELLG